MFQLRDNLHWCVCGGRVIFLDLNTDRYLCLPLAAEAAFARLSAGTTIAPDREHLQGLLAEGMLLEAPGSPGLQPTPPIKPAKRDFMAELKPSANIPDLLGAIKSELWAAWLLRRRPLIDIVRGAGEVSHRKRTSTEALDARLTRIVGAFEAAAMLRRAADRCLVRALALHAVCQGQGIHPKLVFGVRVDPFGAHCWVQLDDAVLIGDFEQVRLFTPLMGVG